MVKIEAPLEKVLKQHKDSFCRVVTFNNRLDKILLMDFTANNKTLPPQTVNSTDSFSTYVNEQLQSAGALYGIGGYNELRTLYARSEVFDSTDEPRRLHLGIDIWGAAGTPVFTPMNGTVHSIAFNNRFGDYGATIILRHELHAVIFHTLYGHLSLASLAPLTSGQFISAGLQIATFGVPAENGYWPPHLHFQIITDMEGMLGDYPGVCKFSEKEKYLANCPDPDLILNMMQHV